MGNSNITGRVVSIQRCSVHDGPGLRTTVFMKGCQLSCPWCHNPESIAFGVQEMYYPEKCIGCGECENGCFSGARMSAGADVTLEDIMLEVYEDEPFYGKEGGVTVSGGEPLCQAEFVCALLDACRARGILTALESNLCFPAEKVRPVLERLDLLMADLKLFSSEDHRRWTGMGNEQVKANLILASDMGVPLVVRTPVVPGVNDTREEISRIAAFVSSLSTLRAYELLAYHPLGVDKAKALGIEQPDIAQPSPDAMREFACAALEQGVRVLVNAKPFAPNPGNCPPVA